MKRTIAGTIGYLIGIALTVFYVKGVIHSYKKHSKIDFAISFVPPWGMFRGIESLWHKSPTKEISQKDEGINVLRLLTAMPENIEEQNKLNEAGTKFNNRIKNHPKERTEYLKEAANMYVRFHSTLAEEMGAIMRAIIDSSGNLSIYGWDRRCVAIMDSLIFIYGAEEMRNEYGSLNADIVKMRNGVREKGIDSNDKEALLNELSTVGEKDKYRVGEMYKRIFGISPPVHGY